MKKALIKEGKRRKPQAASLPPSAPAGASRAAADPSHLLEGLNDAQKKAVLHGEGPLLIVAGAGTGKTTVLAKRIAHLIIGKRALPKEILALTFTDKAAGEMEERVDKLVPYGFNDVWISTFHSFGDRILREYAFQIGLAPDLRVLSLPEAIVFLRQHLESLELDYYRPLADPTRFVESLLTTFSRAKDEEIGPAEFIACAKERMEKAKEEEEKEEAAKCLEAARAYDAYEHLKRENGFIDFGDQVILALKILRERPSVLAQVRSRFKYLLVDEFQDTNYAQFELLKLIAAEHRNITVVGDDDQSIYKFRGACLSNILGFRAAYPEAEQVVLQENYRSTQEILDAAYKLIQHNNPDRLEYRDKLNKRLRAARGSGRAVRCLHFDTLFAESEFAAEEIRKRVRSGQWRPRDFALLVRTNAAAEPFMKSLNLVGLPWRFSGNAGLYEQEEIQTALAFLRVLDQPNDSASLYYLAVSPLYELESEACALLGELAGKTKRSLFQVFEKYRSLDEGLEISPAAETKIKEIVTDVKRFRTFSLKMRTGNLLYNYLDGKGVFKRLAGSTDLGAVQEAQNLHHFFELVKRFAQVSTYDRVHHFIQYVESLRLAGDDPASSEAFFDEDAVNLLTVHAAKGLEFRAVFLVGLEQGHFPVANRGELIELPEPLIKDVLPSGDYHLQEERRLFYVGMTRAKEELILASARDQGKKRLWKPSQFVLEAMDKPQAAEAARAASPLDSIKLFAAAERNPAPPAAIPEGGSALAGSKLTLNVTAVEDYSNCPLRYKFARVLKIPVLMHHTAVFGIAVHEALRQYHLARRNGKKMELEELIEAFKKAWRSEGFVSREHEEKRLQEGLRALKDYYGKEEAGESRPTLIEESFRLVLGNLTLHGRWDRVDVGKKESLVIDYKTGDAKDQKDADDKAKKSTQLLLYSLAFRNRFGKLPDKTVLSFVKSGLTGTAAPTPERLAKAEEEALKVGESVARRKFDPKPGYQCRWCAYERICPAAER